MLDLNTSYQITFLLLIKGRLDHVRRWFAYHDDLGFPINVIVGDGAPTEESEALFSSPRTMRCQYIKYNDNNFSDFYKKLSDMTAECKTKYCMVVEDDDFILVEGVLKLVGFLDRHNDYSAVSGEVLDLFLKNAFDFPSGKALGVPCCLLPARKNLGYKLYQNVSSNKLTRTRNTLSDFQSVWYAVVRTSLFREITKNLAELDPPLLDFQERYYAAKLAEFGKVACLPVCFYIRQRGSSLALSYKSDWLDAILEFNYGVALNKFIKELIPHGYKNDPDVFDDFKDLYLTIVRDYLGYAYLPKRYKSFSDLRIKFSLPNLLGTFPRLGWFFTKVYFANKIGVKRYVLSRIFLSCKDRR